MKKNNRLRIVFTGAHAGTVALALIEEIEKRNKDWGIHFIGPKYAFEDATLPSSEETYLKEFKVLFHPIISGKIIKQNPLKNIVSLMKIIMGVFDSFIILSKIKPNIVVSFGGYLGVPVVICAWVLGIPVILHEQVIGLGLGNRISSFFAKKIAIARSDSLKFVPEKKAVLVGNPIRGSVFTVKPKLKIGNPPTIFVFTGSRASKIINDTIEPILVSLLHNFKIIHLSGRADYKHFNEIKNKLNLQDRYEVYDFISPGKVSDFYKRSDILICRAGANTVSELLVIKRPSILIPIPWSIFDEQRKNALFAKKFGLATIIDQSELTPKRLFDVVNKTYLNWDRIVENIKDKQSPDIKATKNMIDLISKYI